MTTPSEADRERRASRPRPPTRGSELEILTGMLDFYRATVMVKVDGLTEDQARAHPVPASQLSAASVVKHLTATERWWFSLDFAARDVEPLYPDGDPDGGFSLAPEDTITALVRAYDQECQASRDAIAGAGPDDDAAGAGMDFTLRFAMVHMIEETARHCGHLDLLVESIDGRRGS